VARAVRIEYEGAFYYVMARGNRRERIFADEKDCLVRTYSNFFNRRPMKSGHLPKEAVIKYNLACYSCQEGDIQNAKNYLKRAFEIDLNWRIPAFEDKDLKPLWESL